MTGTVGLADSGHGGDANVGLHEHTAPEQLAT
jgi:hypothetical protein